MTCQIKAGGCGYEFCWICLGEWKTHGGSYYKCEKYNPNDFEKKKQSIKSQIKLELEKYANYFESYNEEEKNLKIAEGLKNRVQLYKETLEKEKNQPYLELNFLDEALETVIDCHRILKNTYIFGYFMISQENSVYTHHQEMLRKEADLLHELIELNELPRIIGITSKDDFNKEFSKYKGNLNSRMSAISKFRESLLKDIENHPDYIDYNLLKNYNFQHKQKI